MESIDRDVIIYIMNSTVKTRKSVGARVLYVKHYGQSLSFAIPVNATGEKWLISHRYCMYATSCDIVGWKIAGLTGDQQGRW
jgi:hypothetical protein